MITIKAPDIKEAQALLEANAKQVPFALALTLTRMAQLVKKGEYKVMAKRFDRPTKSTLNSLFTRPASKTKLQSVVGVKDSGSGVSAEKYLQASVYGSSRRRKRFEKALIRKGVMRPDQYAMPNKAYLDQNGNIKGAFAKRLLKAVDPNKSAAPDGKKTRASRWFVGEVDGEEGIWERKRFGKDYGVRPVFVFTSSPNYRVLVPFFKIADNIIKANYERELINAVEEAMSTAR